MRHIDLSCSIVVDGSDWRDLRFYCWRRRDDRDDWDITVIVGHVFNYVSVEFKTDLSTPF
jgi:hypothetical protein